MGEIIATGILSHTPTIMLPKAIRYELNNGKESTLVSGLETLRNDVIKELAPDVIIVLDTHWYSTVEFLVSGHQVRKGIFTSEELPRGMSQIPYSLEGDPLLADTISNEANSIGISCTVSKDPYLPIRYPTINLAHYLNNGESWLSMSICQTAELSDFLHLGRALGNAIEKSDTRAIIIGSGGMSHAFWPLSELKNHEAADPIHIRTPEARLADEERIKWWQAGRHDLVINNMPQYYQHQPEGLFGHYLIMIGAIGGSKCVAPGRKLSTYENSAGTGQIHMWFDCPKNGWPLA